MSDSVPKLTIEPAKPPMSSGLFRFGAVATTVWLIAGTLVMVFFAEAPSKANEWGDVFAGLSAPIAFLWLVLGFLQQGEELRLSTHALKLQAEELKNSVEQQRKQAEAQQGQLAAVLAEQARQREAELAAKQPMLFLMSRGWRGPSEGNTTYTFTLINDGATIEDLRLATVPPAYQMTGDYHSSFRRDASTEINVVVQGPPRAELALHFTYRDADRLSGRQIFIVRAGDQVTVERVPPSPPVALPSQ